MGTIHESKVAPKGTAISFVQEVHGDDLERWSTDLYPWLKEFTVGSIYVDKMIMEPYRKPIYHVWRLWFTKKSDAAYFKLQWMIFNE